MPELPEVETVKRTLQAKLTGLMFTGGQVLLPKVVREPKHGEFIETIKNKKILKVGRRSKYLLLGLSGGYTLQSTCMTGRLVYCALRTRRRSNIPVVLHLITAAGLFLQICGSSEDRLRRRQP